MIYDREFSETANDAQMTKSGGTGGISPEIFHSPPPTYEGKL